MVGIFFGARLIAMRIKQRPDYEKILRREKHAKFYARSYKDMCYSFVKSYVHQVSLTQLSSTVATLFPKFADAGFDVVSGAMLTEISELLDLIVHEKGEFFWLYNKYFQKGVDNWK